MLVLSRKEGEQVRIGEDIILTVVRLGPYSVRIGVEAPEGVVIVRKELQTSEGAPDSRPAPAPFNRLPPPD